MEGTEPLSELRIGAHQFDLALALTLAPPHPAANDFDGVEATIDCAIGTFREAAPYLGDDGNQFLTALSVAKDAVGSAAAFEAQGEPRKASSLLRHAARKVIDVALGLRAFGLRKTLPDTMRRSLLVEMQPIESGLRALRRTL
jgi:hypothetical protein